jgi:hypothetical protein
MICEEVLVNCLKVITWNSPAETEESHGETQDNRISSIATPVCCDKCHCCTEGGKVLFERVDRKAIPVSTGHTLFLQFGVPCHPTIGPLITIHFTQPETSKELSRWYRIEQNIVIKLCSLTDISPPHICYLVSLPLRL